MKCNTRVRARAVPVAPVTAEVADRRGDLLDLRFQLLKADHVRLRALDPLEKLLVPRADAVDVPGGHFHAAAILCPPDAPTCPPSRTKSRGNRLNPGLRTCKSPPRPMEGAHEKTAHLLPDCH